MEQDRKIIIPVAGGKGGVGKSVVTANLGIALAKSGKRVVAADLDLGGSNLHGYLGMNNRIPGIGEFIRSDSKDISEFFQETDYPGLTILPGGLSPFMANITWSQKKRIVEGIRGIDADVVLLDLGGGSSFNTLDFFSLSDRGILVTNPDFISVISMLSFLKSFIFRYLLQELRGNRNVQVYVDALIRNDVSGRNITVELLKRDLEAEFSDSVEVIERICSNIRPLILFNRAASPDGFSIIKQFSRGMKTVLSVEADFYGFIFEDSKVRESLKMRKPLLNVFPDSIAAEEFSRIAERILKFYHRPLRNSAEMLESSTKKFYENFEESRKEDFIEESATVS